MCGPFGLKLWMNHFALSFRYVRVLGNLVHAIQIKTKLCQLVEVMMERRDDLSFCQEMKFRWGEHSRKAVWWKETQTSLTAIFLVQGWDPWICLHSSPEADTAWGFYFDCGDITHHFYECEIQMGCNKISSVYLQCVVVQIVASLPRSSTATQKATCVLGYIQRSVAN